MTRRSPNNSWRNNSERKVILQPPQLRTYNDDDDELCSIRHWPDVPRPPSKVYPLPTGPIPRAVEGQVKSSQVVGLRDRVAIIRALLHAISSPHPYAGYSRTGIIQVKSSSGATRPRGDHPGPASFVILDIKFS